MNNTLKNLLLVLGLVTVGYVGYYLYSIRTSTTATDSTDDAEFQAMLTRTQLFIQRSQDLNAMQVDLSVLEEDTFNSLQNNSRLLQEVDAGRNNPFAGASSGG